MGLVQAVQHFVDHRIDVVRRRTAYLLMKAREREHVLEGYQVALCLLYTSTPTSSRESPSGPNLRLQSSTQRFSASFRSRPKFLGRNRQLIADG